MIKKTLLSFLLPLMTLPIFGQQGQAIVSGLIQDENQNPLFSASISIVNTSIGTVTDHNGQFRLEIPANQTLVLQFSFVGFNSISDTLRLQPNESIELIKTMRILPNQLDNVIIKGNQQRSGNLTRIDIKSFSQLPNSSGNIEAIVKTLPGVVTGNELSSQYSVRGGSFDENLIYVNDIEIYRPLLVQSAQQEGLSFVNSDMVSSIEFSAGGFDARYGDKMSSVLDIKYHKPQEFGGGVMLSLLGANLHVEGVSKNKRFAHTSGLRYKTTKYLLGSLDTKGEYAPNFIDFQTFLSYNLSQKTELSLLGNISTNRFSLIPENRDTDFGTIHQTYRIRVFYEGQEEDQFDTYMGAAALTYQPSSKLKLKFIGSAFRSNEQVNYDILSDYWLGALSQSSSGQNDSLINIGTGSMLDHARNKLNSQIYSLAHNGIFFNRNMTWKWGLKWQYEDIEDSLNEWQYLDSTGYSIPYDDQALNLYFSARSEHHMKSNRLQAYVQNTINYFGSNADYSLTLGVRSHYWDYNKEFLLSPRASLSIRPNWEKNLAFHLSGGLYAQPAFYKEFRDPYGNLYKDIKAQRSIHFLLGTDLNFTAWDRPFIFTTEIYYKKLDNLIPYKVDNVRLKYLPQYTAKGYATGIDFKLYGEFVPGTQSWFSLSFLKTREDADGDSYTDMEGNLIEPGYYRRPGDQLMTMSIFFQDYLPMNPNYKVHLMLNYGTGLPYSGPSIDQPSDTYSLGQYRRLDIGFSRVILRENKKGFSLHNIWISAEILNVLDASNKVSYDWVRTVANNEGFQDIFAVPNYLTGRRLNFKISAKF